MKMEGITKGKRCSGLYTDAGILHPCDSPMISVQTQPLFAMKVASIGEEYGPYRQDFPVRNIGRWEVQASMQKESLQYDLQQLMQTEQKCRSSDEGPHLGIPLG